MRNRKTEEQIRSHAILNFQKHLLNIVNEDRIKKENQDIIEIANRNQMLLQCEHNTFVYRGKWYSGGDTIVYQSIGGGKRKFLVNKKLHKDMRIEMDNIFNPEFEWVEQNAQISNYFGILLREIGHIDDLRSCLPWQLHKELNRVHLQIFNISVPWNEAKIAAFKEENKEGLHCLNCIYITQLLVGQ